MKIASKFKKSVASILFVSVLMGCFIPTLATDILPEEQNEQQQLQEKTETLAEGAVQTENPSEENLEDTLNQPAAQEETQGKVESEAQTASSQNEGEILVTSSGEDDAFETQDSPLAKQAPYQLNSRNLQDLLDAIDAGYEEIILALPIRINKEVVIAPEKTVTLYSTGTNRHMTVSGNYPISIKNIVFEGGSEGGGIEGPQFGAGQQIKIEDCIFSNCAEMTAAGHSPAGCGGGIRASRVALSISGTEFRNCGVGYYGAAVYLSGGSLSIDDVLIDGTYGKSSYGDAGAIYLSVGNASAPVSADIRNLKVTNAKNGAIQISAGSASGDSAPAVNITNTEIWDCEGSSGTAIHAYGAILLTIDGLDVWDCVSNTRTGSGGAALRTGTQMPIVIRNSTFKNCKAIGNGYTIGGAMEMNFLESLLLDNVVVENCEATMAGALTVGGNGKAAAVEIRDCIFKDNKAHKETTVSSASAGSAGAINIYGGTLNIKNTQFLSNTAENNGGAIVAQSGSTVFISDDSLFEGNTAAQNGGAIYLNLVKTFSSTLTAEDTTFRKNSSNHAGGAVYAESTVDAKDCSFIENETVVGGGAIYMRDIAQCSTMNTIFKLNKAQTAYITENDAHIAIHAQKHIALDATSILHVPYLYNNYDINYSNGNPQKTYLVTYSVDGDVILQQQVLAQDTAEKPATPKKTGYRFYAWMRDGNVYDFSLPVTEDFLLEAVFKKVNDDDSGSGGQKPAPDPETDIEDGQVPQTPGTPEMPGDGGNEGQGETEIDETDTPQTGTLPQTGSMLVTLAAMLGVALTGFGLILRKKKAQ